MPQNFEQQVYDAIIKGIRRTGEAIFDLSQRTESCFVPVDTGFLKNSGYVKDIPDGVEIGYTAPYASKVEFGNPYTPYSGVQTVRVKAHTRRPFLRADGTWVEASEIGEHERRYEDRRLVGFRPKLSKFERGPLIFRILKGEPERKGQLFLSRALHEKIADLPNNIEFYLRRIPGVS